MGLAYENIHTSASPTRPAPSSASQTRRRRVRALSGKLGEASTPSSDRLERPSRSTEGSQEKTIVVPKSPVSVVFLKRRSVIMGSESDLKMWVSDKLMTLSGYSQPTIVQYIIGISKQASSPADVLSKLVEFGLPSASETRAFSEESFAKVPRKASRLNLYQKQEREAAMLVRKQKNYTILEADDEDDDNAGGSVVDNKSPVAAAPESRKTDTRKKRFRKKIESQKDEDDEVIMEEEKEKRAKRQKADNSESDEEERVHDQREREQLEQYKRTRCSRDTKGKFQDKIKKREQKKLEEIRDDVEDEQYLFEGVKLTEAKHRGLRYKKEIYELVKKRSEEADATNEYRMLEAYDTEGGVNQEKRFAVALQRYRDTSSGDKMNPFAEQEAWEEHQIGKAHMKFGSKNRKQTSDDYHFVFEDQIEFIKASVMDGVNFDVELPTESLDTSRAKTELERLKAERKTLPIYAYRDDLLNTINDHQVLVIVDYSNTSVSS